MTKSFKHKLDIFGGERTLHVNYDGVVGLTSEAEIRIKSLVPKIFKRAVMATNHAWARGLAYESAAALESAEPGALPYTRLKDWLKIQRKMVKSDVVTMWNSDSFDFIYGPYRKKWKVDRHSDTKEIFSRLLGADHTALHQSMLSSEPSEYAKIFRESLMGVISGMNLENVYIRITTMNSVGSSGKSHGNWRLYHEGWNTDHANIAYERNRMEEHLVSDYAKRLPISLSVKYISTAEEGGQYSDVYGASMTLEDHITKTFLHEGGHMWVAAEDHYYWRPKSGKLAAYASLSRKAGVSKNDIVLSPETERCVLNADTLGWFLYWWGKA